MFSASLIILILNTRLAWAVCIAIIVQFPLAHSGLYFFFRFDALLWGVGLGILPRSPFHARLEPIFLGRRPIGSAFVLVCLFCLFKLAGVGNAAPPFVIGSIAFVSAMLVWVATYDRDYLCPPVLRELVLWAGSRPYGFYVAHIPAFLCSAALAHHYFTPQHHLFSGAGNRFALLIVMPLPADFG